MSPKEFEDIKVEEAPKGTIPKCPFCNNRLDKVWIKKKGIGILEQNKLLCARSAKHFPVTGFLETADVSIPVTHMQLIGCTATPRDKQDIPITHNDLTVKVIPIHPAADR